MIRYLKIPLVLFLAMVSYQCNSTDSESDVDTFESIIYGEVANFDSTTYPYTVIQISIYPDGCGSDSTNLSGIGGQVQKSGKYKDVFHDGGHPPTQCYEASLVNVKEDTIVLDGPKEFDPPFREEPPYDSVRIDFTYPDSFK